MATKEPVYSLSSILWTKGAYKHVASEFHPYHRHDLNVFLHLWTTGLGVWGAVQLAILYEQEMAVYVYAAVIALTTPFWTALLHTATVAGFMFLSVDSIPTEIDNVYVLGVSIAAGYLLQDLAHYLCQEKTYMGSYIKAEPWMLVIHTLWLMPLVIDAVLMRHFFLPNIVTRNRNVVTQVASRKDVDVLRKWLAENVAESKETTHVWPHDQPETSGPTKVLEDDSAIYAGFRKVFAPKHFDIRPIQGMNEIYVTAVGAKKEINSDAVFYTPHNDGPYWFLPWASCYRVLVGLTHNKMVRTRFNLQHESQDQVMDLYGVVGFDYNRELHWIDHVPGAKNDERRSLMKLHYVVYPKGWHKYGDFVAYLNTKYNTWARGNFLRTLRPKGAYEYVMAWWIWITTWTNAMWELYFGWSNLVYILGCAALGPIPFFILTSYRHYMVYITTFAYRKPPVAHGFLMRDAKLFKTCALLQLGRRLLPLVQLPRDTVGLALAICGFSITILATVQLGMVRTYFGSELGFVKPEWISGFPYGVIPHPMIVGQLLAYSSILYWWRNDLVVEDFGIIGTHMAFYTFHMVQEMLTSSY